ncbi:MAG: glutamine synthetase beta-grasp domain-containing protein, partial [Anaerolineales bacterium]|nr:glutamine synthetase beta-grasp domain-containing protein [Anaerolineales bacterium]
MRRITIMIKTSADVIKMAQEVKMVDFRFTDVLGMWHHFTIPTRELDQEVFEEGVGFDGSSIRAFQEIHESDMLLIPDADTAFVDKLYQVPTLVLICNIFDPMTMQPYSRDVRYVAKKAEAYLRQMGIAETSYWGPEAEFYIFNNVRYGTSTNEGFYHIDSAEGMWNSGKLDSKGGQLQPKGGYFPVPPADTLHDVRSKIVLALEDIGIPVEVHHHEVGAAGQSEIGLRFNTLTRMADSLMMYKYTVKNVTRQNGLTATFMPKPLF